MPWRAAAPRAVPARSAGSRPTSKPVRTVSPSVNSSTRPSSRTASGRATASAAAAISRCTPSQATASPSAPPARASTAASAKNGRVSSLRPAPRAARTASSRSRPVSRASSRLARLAQTIRSTTATAANRVRRGARTSPTTVSRSGTTPAARQPSLVSGCSSARCARAAPAAERASATPTPGARRPTASCQRIARWVGMLSSPIRDSGAQRSTPRSSRPGNRNDAGITPITVNRLPESGIVRPTIAGSASKRRCHRPSESTATRSLPSASPSGRSVRPSAAVTPIVEKKSPETYATSNRSGRSPPLSPPWPPPPPAPRFMPESPGVNQNRARDEKLAPPGASTARSRSSKSGGEKLPCSTPSSGFWW